MQTLSTFLLILAAIYTASPLILASTTFSIFLGHTNFSKLCKKYLQQLFRNSDSKVKATPSQPKPSSARLVDTPKVSPPIAKDQIPAIPESLKGFYQKFIQLANYSSDDKLIMHLDTLISQADLARDLKKFAKDFSAYVHGKIGNNMSAQKPLFFLANLIPDFNDLITCPFPNFTKANQQKMYAVNILVFCYLCSCCVENGNSPAQLSCLLRSGSHVSRSTFNFYSRSAHFLSLERIRAAGNLNRKVPSELNLAIFLKLFEVLLRINFSLNSADDLKEFIFHIGTFTARFEMASGQLSKIFNGFASPHKVSHGLGSSPN